MIRQLLAHQFRNLASLEWSVEAGSHLLTGGTGQGKTSVLESLYLVATTRSFRTSRIADCASLASGDTDPSNEPTFYVAAEVERAGRVKLEISWSTSRGPLRRVNGDDASLAQHLAQQPVLAWTAVDAETLSGAPELRRRLLNRGIVNRAPALLDDLSRYRRALQQKRVVLQRRQGGLQAWNELLAGPATRIITARRDYTERLQHLLIDSLEASSLGYPEVRLRYRPSPPQGEDEAAMLMALEQAESKERERSQPMIGPHRDRLDIEFAGRDVGRIASAGERKAVGLLLLQAQARLLEESEKKPILLLDDLDIELDRETLGALWPLLVDGRQSFVTSNRPEVFEALPIDFCWGLDRGTLSSL